MAFICSEALLQCWAKLVELAGFEVEVLPEEATAGSQIVCESYVVRYGRAEIAIAHNRRVAGEPHIADQILTIVCRPTTRDRLLGQSVVRILVASGARNGRIPWRVFRCERRLLDALRDGSVLAAYESGISSSLAEIDPRGDWRSAPYFDWQVREGRARLQLYTGPALDPDAGRVLQYVAIRTGRAWLPWTRRENRTLIESITSILRTQGAIPIR